MTELNRYRVSHQSLIDVCTSLFAENGVPLEDAKLTAEALVDADLHGVSSHGVIRAGIYIKRLQEGIVRQKPDLKIVKETDNTVVLDGGNGLGQVVSNQAMELAIQKAQDHNVGIVSAKNSNHFGTASYWATKALEHDMIGIAASNVPPLMPPPSGAAARIGNNPLSIAVPADRVKPIVLDMATSVVALGKVLLAKSRGENVPDGWAVDKHGQATNRPEEILNGGYLLPVGGPKGYGLAAIIDILTGVLNEGAFGSDVHSMYKDFERPANIGHFFMAINLRSFIEPALFRKSVDLYAQYMKNTPCAPGVSEIFLPGEIEALNYERNLQEGVILPKSLVDELVQYGQQVGISDERLQELTQGPLA
ncbi:Ldh family oxidoreductase [Alicyclobacillus tolerans]|uniref:Ldh family oxidoreductase n=1 Tax=Alicyclobacillus tolerans TaxID=90970 RepID=UPI001F3A5B57|nr:Ldh family oxidoreductase [Alicyclobacillus tolerans]MCF8565099.1 Ldh family oxidoreductase [Alicyclobacillus tolerans]